MSRFCPLLLILVTATGLAGCGARPPLLYAPTPLPTPLFTAAGEVQASATGLVLPTEEGDERRLTVDAALHAAASPVQHLGAFVSASYVRERDLTQRYAEAGAVLYGPFSENLRWEVFGGGGRGDAEGAGTYYSISTSLESYTATAQFERLFVQGNLWLQLGHAQPGLSLRVVRIRFSETEGLRGGIREDDSFRAGYLEPAFYVRSGHRPISFGTQMVLSVPLSEPQDPRGGEVYRSRRFSYGFSLTLHLDDLFGTPAD